MKLKAVSGIMLTLLFVSLLSLALNVGIVYVSGTMSGKVTESDGVTPIVGALVEALQQGDLVVSSTTTGINGNYSLSLTEGAYKVCASAVDYITAIKPVVNVFAETTTVNFNLTKGQMLVFDEFMGTSLNASKWNSYFTGIGRILFFNATSEPTKFSGFFVDSGYGGAGSAAITSKISATLDSTIIFEGRMAAYVEGDQGQIVYGDRQPRGLRAGTDENNAIEFRSASSSIEARTVASGVVTTTNYYVGTNYNNWNWIYRIEANSSIVKFYVNGVLIATHTTNIPTGPLNIYMGTNYPGYGMVGVGADYLYLAQAEVTFHQDGVGTDFTGTVLTVDGTGYTRTDLPKTFTWTIGTNHTFAYHSPLDVSAVKRYVWTHTLGLCTAQSGTITVPSEGGWVTGYYKTQYYLTVVSPYDTAGGMDWYDKDDTAYATLDYGIEDLAPGQRAVFTGWTGDASGTGLTSDPITMNAPKTATALWVIQWHLDVEVIPPEAGTIPGEDWYNNCTTVTLTADTYLPSKAGVRGVRYKFSYWDVDGTPVAGNPIDVHMDATHTATAHYTVQYYLTVKTDPAGIATIPGEGWYDPYRWVKLTAPLEPHVKYLFAYWTVHSAQYLNNSIKVQMNGPKKATAVYKDYLGDAKEEIEALRTYVTDLYNNGKIGKENTTISDLSFRDMLFPSTSMPVGPTVDHLVIRVYAMFVSQVFDNFYWVRVEIVRARFCFAYQTLESFLKDPNTRHFFFFRG
jgi:hypothetical protein